MNISNKKLIFLLGVFLIVFLLVSCGVPEEDYNRVNNNLQAALADLSRTKTELGQTKNSLTETTNKVLQLDKELVSLKSQHDLLQTSYVDLKRRYANLEKRLAGTQAELEESLVAPYTAISGREITYAWKDLSGKLHKWTLPVDSYRKWIEIPKPDKKVLINSGGKLYTLIDFRQYVRTEGFGTVIPELYRQSSNEKEFAREVFNLATQLTVYSKDIGEVPRWPVETLTEAGGDCEDLAILFASLLKAAPFPYRLSLVYIDGDYPTDPKKPNHVIVQVDAGNWRLFAECTNKDGWNFYDEVKGWFFEL